MTAATARLNAAGGEPEHTVRQNGKCAPANFRTMAIRLSQDKLAIEIDPEQTRDDAPAGVWD